MSGNAQTLKGQQQRRLCERSERYAPRADETHASPKDIRYKSKEPGEEADEDETTKNGAKTELAGAQDADSSLGPVRKLDDGVDFWDRNLAPVEEQPIAEAS